MWEVYTNLETVPCIDLYGTLRIARERQVRTRRRSLAQLSGMGMSLLVIILPMTLYHIRLKGELLRTEQQAAALQGRAREAARTQAQFKESLESTRRFQESQRRRQAWAAVLHMLSARAPEGICLQQFRLEGKGAEEQMGMDGAADSMSSLQQFLHAILETPFFTQLRLGGTTQDKMLGPNGVQFRVEAHGTGIFVAPEAPPL